MDVKNKILGIDTSNYKTSVAIVDKYGSIISDVRKLLHVKQGERGLRQSNALFQHIENLPGLFKEAFGAADGHDICAVCVSSRPRPAEGSYMPVFTAGLSTAYCIGNALHVPVYETSHQEGHIEAVISGSYLEGEKEFNAYHLSGGTCELLHVTRNPDHSFKIDIAGGSRDISFGQVIDRAGVAMGLMFPSGEEMDRAACSASGCTSLLKGIPVSGLEINLSGIDSQMRRVIEESGNISKEDLICELFRRIARSIERLTLNAAGATGINTFVFAGGVSGSRYIKKYLEDSFRSSGIRALFGDPVRAQDNAIGVALLGAKRYRYETGKSITD